MLGCGYAGSYSASASGSRSGPIQTDAGIVLNNPRGIAVDAKGNLYVADTDEGLIRKIAPDGMVTTVYPATQ